MIAETWRRRVAAAVLAGAALTAVVPPVLADGASPPAARKSIFDFDDDDKPQPPAATPAERAPETPATPDTPESKPADPEKMTPQTPGSSSSSSSGGNSLKIVLPPAVRESRSATPRVVKAQTLLSVPDPKAQERALRTVKEQFKTEYRATGAERAAGARKLLEAGVGAQDDPETSFVLLKEARDMASSAGDARTGLVAARQIAGRFSVDLTEMGLGVLQAASRNANTADRAADVAVVAMTLLGRAADAQQFDLALRIAQVAEASARVMRSAALTSNLGLIVKDLRARKQVADKLPAALDEAKKNPNDPEACAVIGRHACLEEGNWADGLAFLAKGNDSALKNLALREAAAAGGPTEAMAQADLGNQWWTAAQSQPVTARLRMQERAAYWYARAMPRLLGTRKDQAAARIASAKRVLPEVVLMPVAVPNDPGKARQERAALGAAEPLGKGAINESVQVPTGKAFGLADKTWVPDKGDRVDITLGPGAELRGGKIYLAGRGHLVLRGSAEKPAVLRNVRVSMDLNGSFTAEYAVIENCTFAKEGAWYSNHSSRWTFKDCVLYRCKFSGLDATNYGFKIDDCRLIGMTFPEVQHKRELGKEFNHMEHLRQEWNHIAGCEFDDCVLPPTVAWCAEESNFVGCKFLPGEAFEGKEDFEWRAFVAETSGEAPQAVWDARPGTRGKVKYVPLERPVDVPQVGPRLIPEVTYATKAVVKNE